MTINTNLDKIKKYLATEVTTYALLLDGEWGSGKNSLYKQYTCRGII
ncbi:hypothetical protein [Listeria seeligeri]|nr:hypothetical protein [Listeria seeligeri]MBC1732856.1 hypothetical protein [Listeria seeligeri]MBC1810664.1 hypothetical protein [Listeria seeligeri]MBC1895857.1 hypothetical protein [Listeria seeligeri]MBC1996408.1 hypothetical protein [Listeria seeligeri]MBC2227214.1 hypothetical protein [Listeria seeligeri]